MEELMVNSNFLKDESKRLPSPLNHLKVLKVAELCFAVAKEVSSVLALLRSSPNMRKLTIQMKTLKEVVRFPRASAKAEIKFEDRIQWQTRI
ncbi:hypothetical protein JCGZ_11823 [Jatropha curcas]|uniref:FBD domain-containing protein n=1 Tax=Jatropha curcas TaxID=180498 RepID=A0A067K5P5_JATCU|nr:hypothetical protein JCGZ_11823 [Jatropha curcas]